MYKHSDRYLIGWFWTVNHFAKYLSFSETERQEAYCVHFFCTLCCRTLACGFGWHLLPFLLLSYNVSCVKTDHVVTLLSILHGVNSFFTSIISYNLFLCTVAGRWMSALGSFSEDISHSAVIYYVLFYSSFGVVHFIRLECLLHRTVSRGKGYCCKILLLLKK